MPQVRNEILLQTIGNTFKRIREEKGLTQEQVYNDTGVHIGRIETATNNLSISTVYQICQYYEVTLADLFKKMDL